MLKNIKNLFVNVEHDIEAAVFVIIVLTLGATVTSYALESSEIKKRDAVEVKIEKGVERVKKNPVQVLLQDANDDGINDLLITHDSGMREILITNNN